MPRSGSMLLNRSVSFVDVTGPLCSRAAASGVFCDNDAVIPDDGVIAGRVFNDINGNGVFDPPDERGTYLFDNIGRSAFASDGRAYRIIAGGANPDAVDIFTVTVTLAC